MKKSLLIITFCFLSSSVLSNNAQSDYWIELNRDLIDKKISDSVFHAIKYDARSSVKEGFEIELSPENFEHKIKRAKVSFFQPGNATFIADVTHLEVVSGGWSKRIDVKYGEARDKYYNMSCEIYLLNEYGNWNIIDGGCDYETADSY